MNRVAGILFLGAVLFLGPLNAQSAKAQGLFIYPLKGQSAEQQTKDRSYCHNWAVEQSGYDPNTAQGPRKGREGAKVGAIFGGIAGMAIGAATVGGGMAVARGLGIGAASGGLIGGILGKDKQKHIDAMYDSYLRAAKVCLEAHGYKVD